MALAYYAITPGGKQADVTSGTALSHQTALTVITWDDAEVTRRDQLIEGLTHIRDYMENNDFRNSISNASDPRGYLTYTGGDYADVVWRNATADTESVLDNIGQIALEGYSEVDAPKGEILRDLDQLITAAVQGDFPIA